MVEGHIFLTLSITGSIEGAANSSMHVKLHYHFNDTGVCTLKEAIILIDRETIPAYPPQNNTKDVD